MGSYVIKTKNLCFKCAKCMLEVEKALEDEKKEEIKSEKKEN